MLPKVKILYVDDYDLVLLTVKQMLELEGWQTDVCRDGAAACRQIKSGKQYDLLILDNQLPHASGLTLVRSARTSFKHRDTPIIMFTASDCKHEALAAGANIFLKKPLGITKMVDAIKQLLATQSQVPSLESRVASPAL
ncbi:MAG: response regulator [Pyrinomonadaceae bacterium]|nr:response regulator [Pyrinomonadaceae bacterium]